MKVLLYQYKECPDSKSTRKSAAIYLGIWVAVLCEILILNRRWCVKVETHQGPPYYWPTSGQHLEKGLWPATFAQKVSRVRKKSKIWLIQVTKYVVSITKRAYFVIQILFINFKFRKEHLHEQKVNTDFLCQK